MKRRLALLLCGIVTVTALTSTGSLTAHAAPNFDPPVTTTSNGNDAYGINEAEAATKTTGRKTTSSAASAGAELALVSNQYVYVQDVDFSKGLDSIAVIGRAAKEDSTLEIRLDGNDAANAVGSATIKADTANQNTRIKVSGDITGKHDVYFVVTGGSPITIDSWQARMSASAIVTPTPTPTTTPSGDVNPYGTNEIENATKTTGRKAQVSSASAGVEVALAPNMYVLVQDVDFSQGLDSIALSARASQSDSTLEIRVDGNDAANTVATATIKAGTTNQNHRVKIDSSLTGKHDIYFVATGKAAITLDTWQARAAAGAVVTPTPTPVVTPTPTPVVTPTPTPVVTPVANGVDPYNTNEAEDATKSTGRKSKNSTSGATELAITSGGYVLVKDVDFSKGLDAVTISAHGSNGDSAIAVRIDGMEEANQLGEVKLKSGTVAGTATVRVKTDLTGKHDVYFVVTGTSPVGFDSWKCKASPSAYVTPTPSVTPTPTPVVTPTPTPVVTPTPTPVVTPVSGVNPYEKNEAENATKTTGRTSKNSTDGSTEVALFKDSYVLVKDVDFSKGIGNITINARGTNGDSTLEVRIDGNEGSNKLGTARIAKGDVSKAGYVKVNSDITGKHDLYFVVTGSNAVGFDSWSVRPSASSVVTPTPTPVVTPTPTPVVTPTPTPVVTPTPTPVVTPVASGVDPYVKNEAEDASATNGRKSKNSNDGSTEVALVKNGYILVKDVDFSKGISNITINAHGSNGDSTVAVRIDGNEDANTVGSARIKGDKVSSAGYVKVNSEITGKHDLYFVVTGANPVGIDSWTVRPSASSVVTPVVTPTPTPVVTPTPTPVVTPTPTPVVTPVGTVNPYGTNQAEDATQTNGRKSKTSTGYELALIKGQYVLVKDVDLSKGLGAIALIARATNGVSALDIRLDENNADSKIANVKLNSSTENKTYIATINSDITGTHDLYFVVTGTGAVGFDSWSGKPYTGTVTPTPTPVVTPTPTPVVTPTPTPVVTPTPTPVVSTKLTSDVQINSWGTGYVVNIAVNNNTSSSVNGWKVKLKKSQVKIDSAWCVQVSSEGDYYVLTPESWNSTIGSNQGINFGFQGTGAIGSSIDVIVE